MAGINKSWIRLYSTKGIGVAWVDGSAVRGEGGNSLPRIVIPLTFQMENRPDDGMLAVARIRAWLGTDQNTSAQNALSMPVVEDLIGGPHGYRIHSSPKGQSEDRVDLRFHLTPEQISRMEHRRQEQAGGPIALVIRVEPLVVGLRNFNEFTPGQAPEPSPWSEFGLYSLPFVFWTADMDAVRVEIEESTWVKNVLPGLGYDRVRLVEIALPPPLPDHPSASREFDKARSALDSHRYDDCVAACRGLLKLWESELGASKQLPVATVLADRLSIPSDDPRRKHLDGIWREAIDFVNLAHHPEGTPDPIHFQAREARLALFLTAALSEYVGSTYMMDFP